ncbi:MAG: MerR family transcriptional regulator [Deltaproteobacteria bacterium]|nr:MerR family transcriptional regulator [Deltaproteobacteria bacterium]
MKISELARASGVPLPTLKFYLREGLLQKGRPTGPNQAEYAEEHLARLRLVRALRDDAGLPIEAVARALRAADGTPASPIDAAIDQLERPAGTDVSPASTEYREAEALLRGVDAAMGWGVGPDSGAFRAAARALALARRSFPGLAVENLRHYADAAEQIARREIPEDWKPEEDREAALGFAVLGTVLFEPFLLALRRMAHLSRSRGLIEAQAPRPGAR